VRTGTIRTRGLLVKAQSGKSRLGHTSINITLDIYGHLCEPLDEVAADRLEQLIAAAIAHRTRAEPGLEL